MENSVKKKKAIIQPYAEPLSVGESIKKFLALARLDLIGAVRASCRKRFPRTVGELDGLSQAENEAIKNGGLLSLPRPKVDKLRSAMETDNFIWAWSENDTNWKTEK